MRCTSSPMQRLGANTIRPLRRLVGAPGHLVALAFASPGAWFFSAFCWGAFVLLAATAVADDGEKGTIAGEHRLWYEQPAQKWVEALPVGNGRLGAMVFGGVPTERIQFNEDTLWTGKPHRYHRPGAVEVLPELRRLLTEGKQSEAERLAMERFMSDPLRQKAYQPFGDLWLEFDGHDRPTDYRRSLDLDAGEARVEYRVGDVTYTRQLLASYPAQVIALKLAADRPGRLSFRAQLTSPHAASKTHVVEKNQLAVSGQVEEDGLRFEARLQIRVQDGRVAFDDATAKIDGATEAVLIIAAHTSFKNFQDISADPAERCRKTLEAIAGSDFEAIRSAHQVDHRRLFRRVAIDLGSSPAAALPTDRRIKAQAEADDPPLAALYLQFARYLLIASSRPGSQPANLQGIWNESLKPPWDSKWTVNINTEMNYWPAETTNLAECHEPLFDLIEDCVVTGRETAAAHYGARGWVLHHNTDLWRGTAPINNSNHGIWVTGGAWLALHMWEHYQFGGDRQFLTRRAYPVMKEASLFFTDFLVEDPATGWLISTPSNSPEQGGLVAGPTMDHQIIRTLFGATAAAAETLGIDAEFAARLNTLKGKIAPNQIGRHGQLQEWLEDKDNPKNQHRHVSHLWALFPGCEITPETPELYRAARQSLVFRGDGGTGWSKAWKVNLWAHLREGDRAHAMLSDLIAKSTLPNMFDTCPPFQIDGNFGGASGIVEMLLQSRPDRVELLPALPKAWPSGRVSGLRARGGFEVEIAWQKGALQHAVIRAARDGVCDVVYGGAVKRLDLHAGRPVALDGSLNVATVSPRN